MITKFKLYEGNLPLKHTFRLEGGMLFLTYDINLARKWFGGGLVLVGFKPLDNHLIAEKTSE